MRSGVQAIVFLSLCALVSGALNLVASVDANGGLAAVVATAVSIFGLSLALLFLGQKVSAFQSRGAFVEIAGVMALLYLPVFLTNYWITFTPEWLTHLGLAQISNFVLVLLVFELSLFFTIGQRYWIARLSVVLYVASIVVDLLTKGLIQSVFGARPSGFMANANDGAALLDGLLIAALPWGRPKASGYLWALFALIGVVITLSRSGLVLWFLIAMAYAGHTMINGRMGAKTLTFTALSLALVGALAVIVAPQETSRALLGEAAGLERVQTVVTLLQGDASAIANDPRIVALQDWMQKIPERPFFGHGSDYSESSFGPFIERQQQPPHNLYVARLIDSGLFGLTSLLLFQLFWFSFFLLRQNAAGLVYTAAFAYICIFSHEMDLFRNTLILFPFLATDAISKNVYPKMVGEMEPLSVAIPAN